MSHGNGIRHGVGSRWWKEGWLSAALLGWRGVACLALVTLGMLGAGGMPAAVAAAGLPSALAEDGRVDLVLFYGQGCPHCGAMDEFLQELAEQRPAVRIHRYEVYQDHDNARRLQHLSDAYGARVEGVPTVFVGDAIIVGVSDEGKAKIGRAVEECLRSPCRSPLDQASTGSAASLTLSAVVLGALVDAINPCAFAVLVLLVTAVLGSGGRTRALRAGLVFSLSIFLSYYLMGVGLFSVATAAGVTRGLYVAVTILAIVMGLFNLKDYFWYGRWFVTEVPQKWRPTLKRLLGHVTSVPGAFLIGFVVSLFLLPCTSGPYIVILGLLSRTAERTAALLWLVLYNLVFVSPMVGITLAVHRGLTTVERAEDWRTKHLQKLHLGAGVLLLLLGAGMVTALLLGRI